MTSSPSAGFLAAQRGYDLYAILGVPPRTATAKEITSAYRRIAMNCHPDRIALNAPASVKEHALTCFKHASLANEVLSDPVSKKDYDTVFFDSTKSTSASASSAASASAAPASMSFEEFINDLFGGAHGLAAAATRMFAAAASASAAAAASASAAASAVATTTTASATSFYTPPHHQEIWVTLEDIYFGCDADVATSPPTSIFIRPGSLEFTRYNVLSQCYVLRIKPHETFIRGGSSSSPGTTPADLCTTLLFPFDDIARGNARGFIRDLRGNKFLWSLANKPSSESVVYIRIRGGGLPFVGNRGSSSSSGSSSGDRGGGRAGKNRSRGPSSRYGDIVLKIKAFDKMTSK